MKNLASALVVALAAFTLSADPLAQSVRRYSKPLSSVSVDLATGTVTHGAPPSARSAGTIVDFANNDLGGFVGLDSGNGFCEWFDAGVKGFAGNQSDLMSEITFAYCTSKLDTSAGGPGGSVKLGFYEGYQVGGGAATTAAAVFTLTGLPANTASSSFLGSFNCYFASVTFGALVAFADGPIGYSWKFIDVGTDGILAGTWPFLACVGSCSGATGTLPDRQGMVDAIDKYCPPGVLHSTFTFGTTSGSFTSISMDIHEAADLAATSASYNAATTPNPDTLTASAPVVGEPWTATLTRGHRSLPGAMFVSVRANRLPLANGVQGPAPLPLGAGGRILISGPQLGILSGVHNGIRGTVSTTLPASFELLGLHFAVQATVSAGDAKVSSAVEGTVGTF
ncbi:MAG: hypothetical protein EXS08_04660 [Planctomycetes bacterium]|nr:hypothetical protein [Planctomycetota bacterium]